MFIVWRLEYVFWGQTDSHSPLRGDMALVGMLGKSGRALPWEESGGNGCVESEVMVEKGFL